MKQIISVSIQDSPLQTVMPAKGKFINTAYVDHNNLVAWFEIEGHFNGQEYWQFQVVSLYEGVGVSVPEGYNFLGMVACEPIALYARRGLAI